MRRRFISNKVSFEPFYIEALEDGVSYSIGVDTKYKIDNGDWMFLQKNENSPSINIGSRLYIKSERRDTARFKITNGCRIGGDIRSLSYGDKFLTIKGLKYQYQFARLFYECVSIREVDENLLKFTELTEGCYSEMFVGCSIAKAPILPATTLVPNCYPDMFNGCLYLNHIKMLATDISANNCLNYWVRGVSSTGTFVKNPDATWDIRGEDGIPEGWTVVNDGEESEGG